MLKTFSMSSRMGRDLQRYNEACRQVVGHPNKLSPLTRATKLGTQNQWKAQIVELCSVRSCLLHFHFHRLYFPMSYPPK
ncbi:hypothetical protein P3L10_032705 [Capsicum annuum]